VRGRLFESCTGRRERVLLSAREVFRFQRIDRFGVALYELTDYRRPRLQGSLQSGVALHESADRSQIGRTLISHITSSVMRMCTGRATHSAARARRS
jgi:hypothetical protein